ncbi:hypothetical protein [Mesorhizobium sp. 1M-11]|uniref:hypothetical protein n=1 Tax=Mesorhizobium sp. 1M-11 TaxID=1529006 RepID=UPI000AE302E8|nr:hypothetical protein [Mesorhizobium sp. 1M-11]
MNKLFLILLLGTSLATLGMVNLGLYGRPATTSPVHADPRSNQGKPPADDKTLSTSLLGSAGYSETFERPLFNPTRRKPIPAPIVADAPPPPAKPEPSPNPVLSQAPAPALLGVSVTQATSKALLLASGKQEANWFQNGETIDDWSIVSITKEEVALQRGDQSISLFLYPEGRTGSSADNGNAR